MPLGSPLVAASLQRALGGPRARIDPGFAGNIIQRMGGAGANIEGKDIAISAPGEPLVPVIPENRDALRMALIRNHEAVQRMNMLDRQLKRQAAVEASNRAEDLTREDAANRINTQLKLLELGLDPRTLDRDFAGLQAAETAGTADTGEVTAGQLLSRGLNPIGLARTLAPAISADSTSALRRALQGRSAVEKINRAAQQFANPRGRTVADFFGIYPETSQSFNADSFVAQIADIIDSAESAEDRSAAATRIRMLLAELPPEIAEIIQKGDTPSARRVLAAIRGQ